MIHPAHFRPATTNVTIDHNDGNGPQIILQDMTAPCDGGANGWQWEVLGETIMLCGSACEGLKSDPDAIVSIVLGCETAMI